MFEEYWNGINRVLLDCEDWMKFQVAGRGKSLVGELSKLLSGSSSRVMLQDFGGEARRIGNVQTRM
jgi:hypothetical protein